MVVFDRVTNRVHLHWIFLVNCYLAAFTADERRPLPDLEALLQRSDFACNVLLKADEPVGLFLSWQLPRFRYIEHFAIAHAFRGQIIGKTALNKYLGTCNLPVVLEVEPPVSEINSRRIRFYEREGFELCEQPFIQPPYASGQNSVELRLMEWGGDLLKQDFEQVKNELYRTVYGCDVV